MASKRSLAQNRLYFLWMQEIAEQAVTTDKQKLSKDGWHEACALRFLGFKDIIFMGENYQIKETSTSKLGVSDFSEYLSEIEATFTQGGVKLTFPDYYDEAMGNN